MSQELKRTHTPDVELIESTETGEKHSLMNVNVKGIKKNLAALKMFNELRPSPSFIVVTETWSQDLDQAQISGKFNLGYMHKCRHPKPLKQFYEA